MAVVAVLALLALPGAALRSGRAAARAGRRADELVRDPVHAERRPAAARRRAPTCARPPARSSPAALPRGPGARGRHEGVPRRRLRLPAARLRDRRACATRSSTSCTEAAATRATGSARAACRRSSTTSTRADPRQALIVVTPDGTADASWFDRLDGRAAQRGLRPATTSIGFVDRHYRTIADRRGRAIAGLSNGGHGATLPRRHRARPLQRRRRDVGQHRLGRASPAAPSSTRATARRGSTATCRCTSRATSTGSTSSWTSGRAA